MALIAMAVYCNEENGKDDCLEKTLASLADTVAFPRHCLILSINSYTSNTEAILRKYRYIIDRAILNNENIGTAEAINKAWRVRAPGEHCIKMDDDVVIHQMDWVEQMEQAIERDPSIGIIGLKRKDLIQSPYHEDPHYKSEFHLLPHKPGERWITVERTGDVIGTCTMFNSALLDKIGYLKQPSQYGYDDTLACHRSHLSGFYNCFLSHIEIDHIDNGGTPYQAWKEKHAGENTEAMKQLFKEYKSGLRDVYYNPFT